MADRAANRADAGFEDFYRDHWRGARRLAACVSGSAAAGEDIAQDVFDRMFRTWGTADEPAAYLRVAIVNGCRSYHRRRRTEHAYMPTLVSSDCGFAGAPGERDDVVTASRTGNASPCGVGTGRASARPRSPACSAAGPAR